jgi:hypothetical protein
MVGSYVSNERSSAPPEEPEDPEVARIRRVLEERLLGHLDEDRSREVPPARKSPRVPPKPR